VKVKWRKGITLPPLILNLHVRWKWIRASASVFPVCIGKRPNGRLSLSGRFRKERDLWLLPAIEPNHNLVTAPTEVSGALVRMQISDFSEELSAFILN